MTSASSPTVPRADAARVATPAASGAIGAAALFVAILVALHAIRPDLAPGWHMVSEYAVGPGGWLMAIAFFSLAAALLALSVALAVTERGWMALGGAALLALGGVGAAMGGLFPMDPVGTPMEQQSRSGMLHGVSFMLGVPGTILGITLLSGHLLRNPAWRAARVLLWSTLGLVWLTLIVFVASMVIFMGRSANATEFFIGWQNRALVVAWAVWLAAVAARVRALSR
jgi:hypothetical protein